MLQKISGCFDLLMHIDISDIFTEIQKVSLLYLPQFSQLHVTFEKFHSEVCGMFVVSRNSIFFHYINFSFRDIYKARDGHFEDLSSHYDHLAGDDYSVI